MAKRSKRLNDVFCKNVTKQDRYGDGRGGHGLALLVSVLTSGHLSKTWEQKIRVKPTAGEKGAGRQITLGLGIYPEVSLAKAREIGSSNAELTAQGIDPRDHYDQIPTVQVIGEKIFERDYKYLSLKRRRNVRIILDNHIYPALGSHLVTEVGYADFDGLIRPLCEKMAPTAEEVIFFLRKIFHHCVIREDIPITVNPVSEALLSELPRGGHKTEHYPSMPYRHLSAAINAVRQRTKTSLVVRGCLQIIMLLPVRSHSARDAEWQEFRWKVINDYSDWDAPGWEPVDWANLDAPEHAAKTVLWVIPKEHMKTRQEHRVPVPTQVQEILRAMWEENPDSTHVCPAPKNAGSRLRKEVVARSLMKLNLPSDVKGRKATPHGFRSTFRNFCADHHVPYEVAEIALAHELPPVVRAYMRSDMLEERARLMQAYADYANGDLPPDWRWIEPDPAMTAMLEAAERRAEEAERRALDEKVRADRVENQFIELNGKFDRLFEKFAA